MEFERQPSLKWYWLVLISIYTLTIVALIFRGNPLLYSTEPLHSTLANNLPQVPQPIPSPQHQRELKLEISDVSWPRLNIYNTGSDPTGISRDGKWAEQSSTSILYNGLPVTVLEWAGDSHGLIIVNQDSVLLSYNLSGDLQWTFKLSGQGNHFYKPVIDNQLVYLSHPSGRILALDRQSGQLQWMQEVSGSILNSPIVYKNSVYVINHYGPQKTSSTSGSESPYRLIEFNRQQGSWLRKSDHFGLKSSPLMSLIPSEGDKDLNYLFLASEDRIQAFDLNNLKLSWSQVISEPVIGYPVVQGSYVIVATQTGKVLALNHGKKGAITWEEDIGSPIASTPSYIPLYDRLSVLSKDGYLHVLDARSGKRQWRYNLQNENISMESWSAKLNARMIQLSEMRWSREGWTIWSPCVQNRLCVYNPDRGQILSRISLSASLASLPIFVDKDIYLLTKGTADSKPVYFISHLHENL